MGLDIVAPLVPGFSTRGMKRYQKDYVRAAMGQDYVSAYLDEGLADEKAGGASEAQLENIVMKFGESPLFSEDNDQRAHIKVHFELLRYIIQQRVQQAMDAVAADKIFSVAVPHTEEHINDVAKNPLQRQFFETVKKPWEEIYNYAQLNRKNAEAEIRAQIKQQQDDQAKTQQVMGDAERKDFVAKSDQARKDRESAEKLQRNQQQSEDRAEIQKSSVESQAENQRRKTDLDAGNKRLKIQLEAGVAKEKPVQELQQDLINMQGESPSPSDFE